MIPHLVHLFETFDLGEEQLRTTRMINGLGADYRHTVISMDRRVGARRLIEKQQDVGVIGPPDGRWFGLARLLHLLQPDLVLISAHERASAFLAAARLRVPLILQIDSPSPAGRLRPQLLATQLLKRVAAVTTTSPALLPSLKATFAPFDIPTVAIPAGVAVPDVAPAARIPNFIRRPGEIAIGMMLSCRPVAGLEIVMRAFCDAPNHSVARLVLLGNGPDVPRLAREAGRLEIGDRLVFVADVVDPAGLLRACDMFALAESAGNGRHITLEAMAAGLPLIGIGGPHLQDLVADENREFLVAADRRPSLAAKMDAMLRSTQLRRRLGRANLERARERPLAPMAEGYARLFNRLVNGHPAVADAAGWASH